MTELRLHGVVLSSAIDSYKDVFDKITLIWKKEKHFKETMRLVLKNSNKFINAQKEQISATNTLIENMVELSDIANGGDFGILTQLKSSLESVSQYQTSMCDQITSQFIQPFQTFCNFKFREIQFSKDLVFKAVREYQNQLEQFQKTSVTTDGKIDPAKFLLLDRELQKFKENITQTTDNFIVQMNFFNQTKTYEFLNQFSALAKGVDQFLQQSSKVFAQLMPQLANLEDTKKKLTPNVTEGFLSVKRKVGWNKEFCQIKNGKFYTIRPDTRFSSENILDLQLCTIKSFIADKDKSLSARGFQIINPAQKRPLLLQAETDHEKKFWCDAVIAAISLSLDNAKSKHQSYNISETNADVVKIFRSIPGNLTCADCGSDEPTWASINLGILVCLQCSGVHRSLGVHITKVRSLTLDHWDPELIMYMGQLGNQRVNQFLECNIASSTNPKPQESSSREERTAFIKAKYESKSFIPPFSDGSNVDETFQQLLVSTHNIDVMRFIKLILYGADVNKLDGEGKTPLINAALFDNWLYIEALVLFGTELTNDSQNWNALHHACYFNHYRSVQVLCRYFFKDHDVNAFSESNSPLFIAEQNNAKESLAILKEELSMSYSIIKKLSETIEKEEEFSIKRCNEITTPPNLDGVAKSPADSQPLTDSGSVDDNNDSPNAEQEVIFKKGWKRPATTTPPVTESPKRSGLMMFKQKMTKKERRKDKKSSTTSTSTSTTSTTPDKKSVKGASSNNSLAATQSIPKSHSPVLERVAPTGKINSAAVTAVAVLDPPVFEKRTDYRMSLPAPIIKRDIPSRSNSPANNGLVSSQQMTKPENDSDDPSEDDAYDESGSSGSQEVESDCDAGTVPSINISIEGYNFPSST